MPSITPSRLRRALTIDAAALVAIAGALLLVYQWALARPLWLDEEMIAINLRDRSLADLSGPLWLGQTAPWGWLAVQRMSVLALGTSERALRLVPVAAGIGTIAAAVWAGRRWLGGLGATTLVVLCSFAPWLSFYALELKPYSADVLFALLLPVLAVRAAEADDGHPSGRVRAVWVWWTIATLAQWFSNGAVLVVPACAAALLFTRWRRQGWRGAVAAALPGLAWAAVFAVHYLTTLRYSLASTYLQDYWAFALPPETDGVAGRLKWVAEQVGPFAVKPGGGSTPILFWAAYAAGVLLLLRTHVALGLVVGLIPLSAAAFAVVRLVPLYERVALWVLPAVYIGIAAACGVAWQVTRRAWTDRRRVVSALLSAFAVLGLATTYDLAERGIGSARTGRPRDSNHELNDREAVQWLMSQREANDDVFAPRNALPALWWYGDLRIAGPYLGGGFDQDDGRIFQIEHAGPGPDCAANRLVGATRTRRRALVYLGFHRDQRPVGFDEMLVDDFRDLGTMVSDRGFAEFGRVLIVDLRRPSGIGRPAGVNAPRRINEPPRPEGCVAVQLAHHW